MSDKLTDAQLDELSNRLNQFRALIDSDYEGAKLYLAVLASDAIPALIAELRKLRKLRDEIKGQLRDIKAIFRMPNCDWRDMERAELALDAILARHFGKEQRK